MTSGGLPHAPLRAIAFILVGVSAFPIQDVVIKKLSGRYPLLQLACVRCLVSIWPLAGLAWWERGPAGLWTRRPWWHLARASLGVLSFTSYYMAIAALPLAEAAALAFAAPLFLTGLSALILGERVGADRWLAVGVGFVGVLIVLRPGSALFEPAALLAVGSALSYACSQTITRHLGRTESGATMALASTVMFLVVALLSRLVMGSHGTGAGLHPSLAFLSRDWVWRGWGELTLIAAAGLVAGIGGYSLVQAYRAAPAGTVAPFEYVMLLWAVLWGYLFWGDVPGPRTVGGVTLTVGAGLYVAHREARSRWRSYFTRKCARRLRAQQGSAASAQTGRSLP